MSPGDSQVNRRHSSSSRSGRLRQPTGSLEEVWSSKGRGYSHAKTYQRPGDASNAKATAEATWQQHANKFTTRAHSADRSTAPQTVQSHQNNDTAATAGLMDIRLVTGT